MERPEGPRGPSLPIPDNQLRRRLWRGRQKKKRCVLFRHPLPCFLFDPPHLSSNQDPCRLPPPSERLIAQEEEDNAQTTKGGGALDERFEAGAGRCGNGWTREVSSASRHACSFRRPLSETHLPRPLARDEEDGTNVGRFDGGGSNIRTGVGDR